MKKLDVQVNEERELRYKIPYKIYDHHKRAYRVVSKMEYQAHWDRA